MATFNGEKWLQEQINSIVDQKNVSVDIPARCPPRLGRICALAAVLKTSDKISRYLEVFNIKTVIEFRIKFDALV